jgi:hypothetical protein
VQVWIESDDIIFIPNLIKVRLRVLELKHVSKQAGRVV